MSEFDIARGSAIPVEAAAERISAFLRAAYGWMCAGLGITAATAWFVASSPVLLQTIARSGPLYIVLIMGLIGVVLASVVGVFWSNDGLQFVTSFIGVIVFTGLAAYDAQRLKSM